MLYYNESFVIIINSYIDETLKNYFAYDETIQKVMIGNWIEIDMVIFLIISACIKKETPRYGALILYSSFDINLIFNKFIGPLILCKIDTEYSILKANALKYIHIFRNHVIFKYIYIIFF